MVVFVLFTFIDLAICNTYGASFWMGPGGWFWAKTSTYLNVDSDIIMIVIISIIIIVAIVHYKTNIIIMYGHCPYLLLRSTITHYYSYVSLYTSARRSAC